jgi:hypothetical protein
MYATVVMLQDIDPALAWTPDVTSVLTAILTTGGELHGAFWT